MHLYSDRLRVGLVTSLCHRCTPFTVSLTQTGSNRPNSKDKAPFKLRLAAVPKTEDQQQDKCDSQGSWSRSDRQLETLLSGSAPDAQDQ